MGSGRLAVCSVQSATTELFFSRYAQVWVCLPEKNEQKGGMRYEKPLRAMVTCARRQQKATNCSQKLLTTNGPERHDDDVYLDYYRRQMMMFVHLCYDRQYLAIDFLRDEDVAWAPLNVDLVNCVTHGMPLFRKLAFYRFYSA